MEALGKVAETKGARPPALILGMTTAGLAFARSLHRRGVLVYGVDSPPPSPAMSSRCLIPLLLPDISGGDGAWLEFLMRAAQRFARPAVLIPAGDDEVLFVARHREALAARYRFRIPDDDVVEMACDKWALRARARALGIDVPASLPGLDPPARPERAQAGISFPCIVKPRRSHLWRRRGFERKLMVVSDEAELEGAWRRGTRGGEEMLLQELIPGGDDSLYGYLSYFNRQSEPLVSFTKQKLRQFPVRYGNASYQISRQVPALIEQSVFFLRALGYRGLVGLEYKKDPRDGRFKLLDMNPRAVSNQQLSIDCGADIPFLNYADLAGEEPAAVPGFRDGVRYVHIAWDAQAYLVYRKSGALGFYRWACSLANARSFALLDPADPMPFLRNVLRIAGQALRRRRGALIPDTSREEAPSPGENRPVA